MLARLTKTIKRHGAPAALFDTVYIGLDRLGHFGIFQAMTLDVETVSEDFFQCPPEYKAEFLTVERIEEYAADPDNGLDPSFASRAAQRGDDCYAILHDGVVASHGWYSRRPTELTDELEVVFNTSYVYMYHAYTRHEHRGRRLHAIGMARAMQEYTVRGLRGLISCVEANNFNALRSVHRLGYRNIGKAYVIGRNSRYFLHADDACRAIGFSIRPRC